MLTNNSRGVDERKPNHEEKTKMSNDRSGLEVREEMEGENVEEGKSMSDKRSMEIREQLRGLVLAAWSLFCLISVPKCAIWLMGDPGLRLTDWAVRDK